MGTSPEPSLNSPATGKLNEPGLTTISGDNASSNLQEGEKSFYEKLGQACGCVDNPVPAAMSLSKDQSGLPDQKNLSGDSILGFDWLVQQNSGQFDPVLFGDYRDSQDAILSQDFGSFFNEAFPLPDLGSPFNNYNDPGSSPSPKKDLIAQVDHRLEAEDDQEVVPGEDRSQMMNCTKIWLVVLSLVIRISDTFASLYLSF
jgi:AP-1-like factor